MRRPKHPLPSSLSDLKFDFKSNMYVILEDGVSYSMPLELVRVLRVYFKSFVAGGGMLYPTLSRWYKDLDKKSKLAVIRTGNIVSAESDFFPDAMYNE